MTLEELRPEDPRAIGSYRLLARLGAGGMGRVFLGRSSGGRTVAIKLVHAELAHDPDFRRRFRHEVRAAREVGGEFTAPVLDADTESDAPWLATGFIAGPTLHQVVERDHGPLPEFTVRRLAHGLAAALRAVHGAGLVHRDLKPSNVLLTLDGPRVIDFGIARAVDASVATRTGAVIGTPAFMSPEQVRGERVGPAGDVFSLGSVLAFAATGRQPFATPDGGVHALMMRVVSAEPDLDGMTEPLRSLVADCLAKDPRQRPSLDEIARRAAEDDVRRESWLPAGLVERLGRYAVRLLDLEQPDATRRLPDDPAGTPPHPHGPPAAHQPPSPPLGPAVHAAPPPPFARPQPLPPGTPVPGTVPPGAPPPGHPAAWQTRPPAPGRSRLPVYIASAAAVFVAAVVLVVATSSGDGDGEGAVAGSERPRGTAGTGRAAEPPATRQASPGTRDAAGGAAVPAKLVGTWEGEITGGQTRRMTVRQGRTGSEIVTTRTVHGTTECRGVGELVSSGERMIVIRTRVTYSKPSYACSSVGKQSLTLVGDDTVEYRAGGSSGLLKRKT
ncbi:serine/threonine-protein kinase [Actinomadura miaoliensis]|uniref:Protein kinase domain-containing protein n=1 Tax=Actinomadura miaoliensis TaxID=430685 RepID=A0ABP7VS29_9ACTN